MPRPSSMRQWRSVFSISMRKVEMMHGSRWCLMQRTCQIFSRKLSTHRRHMNRTERALRSIPIPFSRLPTWKLSIHRRRQNLREWSRSTRLSHRICRYSWMRSVPHLRIMTMRSLMHSSRLQTMRTFLQSRQQSFSVWRQSVSRQKRKRDVRQKQKQLQEHRQRQKHRPVQKQKHRRSRMKKLTAKKMCSMMRTVMRS